MINLNEERTDIKDDYSDGMEVIRLQNIIFPTYGVCRETDLYYRGRQDAYIDSSKCIIAEEGETFSFDTYFNALSTIKWHKYTTIGDVTLELDYEGSFKLILLKSIRNPDNTVKETPIGEHCLNSDARAVQTFKIRKQTGGMISFKVTSLKDNSRLYGGCYNTSIESDKIRRVNLAVNICTYRREEYVKFNLKNISSQLLSDPHLKYTRTIY